MTVEDVRTARAVQVDLRSAPDEAGGPRDLRAVVREAIHEAQVTDSQRFLLLDRAHDLTHHQHLYEELLSYTSHDPVHAVCLAVGPAQAPAARPAPGEGGPGTDPADAESAHVGPASGGTLLRPRSLTPHVAGVLWVPDPHRGLTPGRAFPGGGLDRGRREPDADGVADAPDRRDRLADQALRPLWELLTDPLVFDAVLGALGERSDGVAVPAPYLLEHHLTEGASHRAWRQALDALAGQDAPATLMVSSVERGTGEEPVPAELAPLIGEEMPPSLDDSYSCLRPGGPADQRRLECEAAIRDAQSGHWQVRAPLEVLRGRAHQADLPGRLVRVSTAISAYRTTVHEALVEGDGPLLEPEQRTRLYTRGIDLQDVPEVSRQRVLPGLRGYAEALIRRRLSLRATASRLAALSHRSSPAGSLARGVDLDKRCPQEFLDRLRSPLPFSVRSRRRYGDTGPAFALALLAGLWAGTGWICGPLIGVLGAWLSALMVRLRPNCSPDRTLDGGGDSAAAAQLLSGVLGGLVGALAGQLLGLPGWAGLVATLLALAGTLLVAAQRWTAAVDDWWEAMEAPFAETARFGVDQLLNETAVHDWLLAEARYHCTEGAQALASVLRGLAGTAETYARDVDGRSVPSGPEGFPGDGEPTAPSDAFPFAETEAPARRPEQFEEWGESWDWEDWEDRPGGDQRSTAEDPFGATPPYPDDPFPGSSAGTFAEPFPGGPTSQPPRAASPAADPGAGAPAKDEPLWLDPPWLERQTGDGGPALVETLVADLTDGVLDLLEPVWGFVDRGREAVGRLPLAAGMTELLDHEHELLVRDSAATPPPYSKSPRDRPGAAVLIGIATDRIARVLTPGESDAGARPLCAASQKRLLTRNQAAVSRLRFAPESVRRSVDRGARGDGWETTEDHVVWTPSGRYAGVLSLWPLRGSAVRTVRPHERGPERPR